MHAPLECLYLEGGGGGGAGSVESVINTLSELNRRGLQWAPFEVADCRPAGGENSDLSPHREPPQFLQQSRSISLSLSFSFTRRPSLLSSALLFGSYTLSHTHAHTHTHTHTLCLTPPLSLFFSLQPFLSPRRPLLYLSHFNTHTHKMLTFVQQSLSPPLRLKLH